MTQHCAQAQTRDQQRIDLKQLGKFSRNVPRTNLEKMQKHIECNKNELRMVLQSNRSLTIEHWNGTRNNIF